jgi:lipopolysaccharide transport system ATP-binding protein
MSNIVITAENLSKCYLVGHLSTRSGSYTALRDVLTRETRNFVRKGLDFVRGRQIVQGDEIEEFWALRDVSFEVRRGEVFGVIGRNGAGKSTLLKILSRITEPTRGRVTIRGSVASLLEVGTGFHPELTGRENIYLNGAILGMTQWEVRAKFDEIVAFAEVEQFIDTPVKRYSSGMYVRLAFSVAAHLEPEILLVDEVLAVGDAAFQKKCLGKMSDVATQDGRTVLFVSHNLAAVQELCGRALLLDRGLKTYEAAPRDVVAAYLAKTGTNAEVDLLNGERQGLRDCVSLTRLWLFDGEGSPTTNFFMNEPFRARIELECHKALSNAEVGIQILSRFGASIHYLTSTWEGFSIDLEPGVYRFEVTMPRIMLFPGTYVVGAWAKQEADLTSDDFVPEATSITVIKGDVNGRHPSVEKYAWSGTAVYAPCEWKNVG